MFAKEFISNPPPLKKTPKGFRKQDDVYRFILYVIKT